ncbi:MAG: dodecin family protein [Lysobacterales bacterium]
MSSKIAKVIEVTAASSKGIEDAVQSGLKKVAKSVRGVQGAWIKDISVLTDEHGKISEWRVDLKVTFLLE